jgi:uncharacterized membrane protein YhiD involved in acid resistance
MWAVTGIGVSIGSGHELLGILLAALIYAIAAWGEWPMLAGLRRHAHDDKEKQSEKTRRDPLISSLQSTKGGTT